MVRRASLVLLVLAACGGGPAAPAAVTSPPPLEVIRTTVHGRGLEGNLLGDSADRPVSIVLPPSYADTSRRFPTLYLLHGIGGHDEDWTGEGYQGVTIQAALAQAIADRTAPEMIVVAPDAHTRYLGSFYVDSSVNGAWEGFIADELVAYVDEHYRTDPRAEARGIAGHSMGGYGALVLASRHPDVFGATYAMAPCCVAMTKDLSAENAESWRRTLRAGSFEQLMSHAEGGDLLALGYLSIAAAWSPDPAAPPLLVSFPYRLDGDAVVATPALDRWTAATPLAMLETDPPVAPPARDRPRCRPWRPVHPHSRRGPSARCRPRRCRHRARAGALRRRPQQSHRRPAHRSRLAVLRPRLPLILDGALARR